MLRELGAETHDADDIVHGLYERPDVRGEVAALVGLDGRFTRSDVARRVFGDDVLLRQLEAIIHPLVRARFADLRRDVQPGQVIVFEYPLPVDPEPGDFTVCVECDEGIRMERLRSRGMQDADAFARIAAAPGAMAYREHANHIIVNDGTIEDLRTQVRQLWKDVVGDAR